MVTKPWYKIEGLIPREDLRDGKPLDASEFAVHLDQVRNQKAPADYQEPERFFDRTYLTKYLIDLAAQVIRRLSGEKTETSAVFNLSTQFGGGKTHALTLLYHLAKNGQLANNWTGVKKLLQKAGINSVPEAAVAVFVGTEFDSLTGRGGDDGTPKRKTPWGEIAYQLGGEAALAVVAEHENQFIEPKGDVIRKFLPKDKPCLILLDEIINYASTYRQKGYGDKLYNFIQALSETARGEDNVVLVVSIPASELEYTAADESDEQRFKKMLDRLGKAVVISAESETSEIIRRRLFEWDAQAVSSEGKILLPKDAINTCSEYADWVLDHRQQLPSWFPVDYARDIFTSTYPFHPTVLSVFERKWQSLPRFQRTRGVLRLLALWVSQAYQEGYKGQHRDALIGLGTAPLDDPMFREAVFNQMGENRLESAVTTDICGKKDAHAIRLDIEAVDAIKKSRLHRKVGTTIFFESNGGCSRTEATVPEIRLAVGEPDLDIGNVETVLETLASECYYLTVEQTKYRFSLYPNLNKILADRRANVQSQRIQERVKTEVQKLLTSSQGVNIVHFPTHSNQIPDRPILTLVVMSPEQQKRDEETLKLVETIIRESGASARTCKSALIFAIADSDDSLREEARKLLAWEDIRDEEQGLDENQKKQLQENLKKAQRDLTEAIWRSYKYLVLLGKDNQLRVTDLGLITSSGATSLVGLILNRLRQDGDVEDQISPRFLIRNWSGAFKEWSTKSVRDAFFASPQFPRLLRPDAIKEAIARGVKEGSLAYVSKGSNDRYEPFLFKTDLSVNEVEISDDIFIIKSEEAEAYLQRITDPPKLTKLVISPSSLTLEPGCKQTFTVKGFDQYEQELTFDEITWKATGGTIDSDGVFQAGHDVGNFIITATVEEIKTNINVSILSPAVARVKEKGESYKTPENLGIEETTKLPQGLSWKGEITPQKWMNFYMRVLSKLTTDQDVKLTLKIEFSIEGEISQQKRDETKVALQELGLDDHLD
ncbi:ATP-binding protein [Planktothrix pseudagardhii]|uniref:AAA family ATPase n=1 Tax=Planktothrix pseudagardhii TaxID=132604 RepID=A0A9W4GBG2_9CYAN|nr:DUF499 domain-containing protein [Planktothrix pseudagardhii]CAD5988446.1 AAA family ATPase [Planktothrix pseudagardhii]